MKTKLTYITLFAFLMTFSGVFAQNAEGISNSDYLTQRQADANIQTVVEQRGPSVTATRLAAAELINYQAVARDAGGNLMVSAAIAVDFEIRDGSGGAAVYNETQNLNTDVNGVFSAQIGSVTPLAGVNWQDIEAWLHVTLDGASVGETQIASVPTALFSRESGQVMMFGSGTNNPDTMIAQHSPAFPGWGIGYSDAGDDVQFKAGGNTNMAIDLATGNTTTDGTMEITQTTTNPATNTLYGNSMAIAYGSIDSVGGISTGYGITSVTNSAVGVYEIVLDLDSNPANTVVTITPFTIGFGTPEICGYESTGSNTFTVRIQDATGTARDSAFSFVVYPL